MQALATLGDAPTAAIAVAAIVLGLLFAARGPRDKRATGASGGAEESRPAMLSVPVAPAPDVEPGFVGPEGTVVGHGPIRLGSVGPLSGRAAAPPSSPAPVSPEPTAPAPEPEPEAVSPVPDVATPGPEPEAPPVREAVTPAPAPEPTAATPAPEPAAATPAPESPLFASPPEIPEPRAAPEPVAPVEAAPAQDEPPSPEADAAPQPAAPPDDEPPAHKEPAWRVAARAANSAMHFRQGTIKVGGKPVKRKDR